MLCLPEVVSFWYYVTIMSFCVIVVGATTVKGHKMSDIVQKWMNAVKTLTGWKIAWESYCRIAHISETRDVGWIWKGPIQGSAHLRTRLGRTGSPRNIQ